MVGEMPCVNKLAGSTEGQEEETEPRTEHVLEALRVRRMTFMEECLPPRRAKDQVAKRGLWVIQLIPRRGILHER